jgi:menaquinone-dependent protoporphyrinogen oxidase
MTNVLVTYDSKHGSTAEVAQTVADTLRGVGLDVHVEPVDHVRDLERVDAVVLGAPVYMGRWTKGARTLLDDHVDELAERPLAVFATGPLHDDPAEFEQARAAVEKALRRTPALEPRAVEIFGGSLEPDDHRFPFNRMERADVRDWDAIRGWARALPERLGVTSA